MLGLLISALWIQTGGTAIPDVQVTFSTPAAPLSRLLPALGQIAGVSLAASLNTANDVMILRLDKAPLPEVMKRLAEVDHASWEKDGETLRLNRTPGQERADETADFQDQVKLFQKAIDKREATLAKMPAFDSAEAKNLAERTHAMLKGFNPNDNSGRSWQAGQQLDAEGPVGRALTRLLSTFKAEDLASLPTQIKAVYSTQPTASQYPLSSEAQRVVEQMIADQAVWADAAQRDDVHNPQVGNTTYLLGGITGATQPFDNVGKVLLMFTRWSRQPSVNVEMVVADAKGKDLARTTTNFSPYADNQAPENPPPATGEPALQLSDISRQVASLQTDRRGARALSPELRQRLLQPEQYDPLGYALSDCFLQTSQYRKENLVAVVPDSLYYLGSYQTDKLTPTAFLQLLKMAEMDVREQDGWLQAAPREPLYDRETRISREDLGQALRTIATHPKLSIEEQAAVALAIPEETSYLPNFFIELIAPHGVRMNFGDHFLRLYGLLSEPQRYKLVSGGLTYGELTQKQQREVLSYLYGPNVWLQYQPPPGQGFNQSEMDSWWNGIKREPTECLPNGIPPNAAILGTQVSDSVVITQDMQRERFVEPGREMDAGSFAWQKFAQDHPQLFPWMGDSNQQVDLKKFSYGKRRQINMQIKLLPGVTLSGSLEERDMIFSDPVPYDQLPDDFRAAVDKLLAQYADQYKNAKPGQFGAQPPTRGNTTP